MKNFNHTGSNPVLTTRWVVGDFPFRYGTFIYSQVAELVDALDRRCI